MDINALIPMLMKAGGGAGVSAGSKLLGQLGKQVQPSASGNHYSVGSTGAMMTPGGGGAMQTFQKNGVSPGLDSAPVQQMPQDRSQWADFLKQWMQQNRGGGPTVFGFDQGGSPIFNGGHLDPNMFDNVRSNGNAMFNLPPAFAQANSTGGNL